MQGDVPVTLTSQYNRVYPLASPGVGVDWAVTVPGGVRWNVQSLLATLTTSAVVANRLALLRISDGSTIHTRLPANAAVVASSTNYFSWVIGGQEYAPASMVTYQTLPFPNYWLPSGWVISSSTVAIDVGDQWSGLVLYVLEQRTGGPPPASVEQSLTVPSS
jgi:hypothetical protein